MNKAELIDSLIKDTEEVKSAVVAFSSFDLDKLKSKPSEDQWSVLECIEHLNIADAHYLTHFDEKFPTAVASNNPIFNPGLLGNYFVKSMKPKEDGSIPSPMKTFKKFRPDVNVLYDTIEKFISDQDRLLEYLEKGKALNLNKNKIPSAIGSIIMFKLGDAFRFLIAHNQRHVVQMNNVLKALAIK